MVKYMVVYTTRSGGTGVINTFRKKSTAQQQVKTALKSKAFKKLGYSRPRIRRLN